MNEADRTLRTLQDALRQAIDANDAQAESVARVNIACVYLQAESPRALAAFEEASASVRRAQNLRSEAILSMAFAPFFLDNGDPARALELAQRGEQLARKGRIGHRVWSLIQLARVLYTGFGDTEQAGDAVDRALAVLEKEQITNPTDHEVVVRAAGQAALAAVQAGDVARAIGLTRIVDPATAASLEGMRQERHADAVLPAGKRDELARLYAAWHGRFESGKALEPRVAEMSRKTSEMLHWDRARSRRGRGAADADSVRQFVERTYGVAEGSQTMASAISAGRLAVTDDDLVFVVGLATDSGFNSQLPAWAVFELVGEAAADRALKGRCLRLAAAVGHQQRPPRELLSLFQRADDALATGADDALRAEVLNEYGSSTRMRRRPGST